VRPVHIDAVDDPFVDIPVSVEIEPGPLASHAPPASIRDELRTRLAGVGWALPAQLGVIGLAAVLYVYNLTVSGFANTYYAMAAQAASQSWSAWFFGSLDAANFITLDKPPLATMLMGLSVRLFGLSSWSILLPEALCGVATVALLFIAVRRYFGPAAATIAGVVAALTPAAVLMFRYDNPDALLTLLLVGAGYACLRSLEAGRLRWVLLAALLVGLGFNTKFLQAYLVLPAFAVTYFVAAPGGLRRRFGHLLAALTTVVASSLWWVAAIELLPVTARPYIGGSSTNSALELLLGYDGLQRIFGFLGLDGRFVGGPGGGSGPGVGFSGEAGILRLFNTEFGGQIAWLLPFALVGLVVGLILRGRAPRTDLRRAAYLMWGGWLVTTGLVFSLMAGVVHTYYAVVLAPGIGALVGPAMVELWTLRQGGGRRGVAAAIVLALGVAGSAALATILLLRTPNVYPWLAPAVAVAGVAAAVLLLVPRRRLAVAGAVLAFSALLAGPAVYALETMNTAYSAGDPQAGPATAAGFTALPGNPGQVGQPGDGTTIDGRPAGFPGGAPDGARPDANPDGAPGPAVPGVGSVDDALISYLAVHHGSETWLVAVSSSSEAAPIQLATGLPVMAVGGFSGGDAALTVDQLQAYVESGQLRYILLGSQRIGGSDGQFSALTAWVTEHGSLVTEVGSGALYDLQPAW
jgi:4-amino-4-deoxy-L-arabinose transferase-like glycosyltransferase